MDESIWRGIRPSKAGLVAAHLKIEALETDKRALIKQVEALRIELHKTQLSLRIEMKRARKREANRC